MIVENTDFISFMKHFMEFYTFVWVIYPLAQAYGMLRLKDSKDPLQGVSKLNLLIIMSKTQIATKSFLPKMIKDD